MSDDDTNGLAVAQPAEPSFLTPKDIQRELQIAERLCYKLLKSGAIPSVKVAGMYRVRREDFKALTSGDVLEYHRN